MRQRIVGVMGPGDATQPHTDNAYAVGRLIARNGWVTLSGGREAGVMGAAMRGAHEEGGLTVGILPNSNTSDWSQHLDIPIVTNMEQARNCINVLTSDALVVVGMNPGTASEAALGIKEGKPVILLGNSSESIAFFRQLSQSFREIQSASTPEEAIDHVKAAFRT